jgi:Leucine-rich repeat (LRR) protein
MWLTLTWLADLSYNNIEVIEGLETLVHLADLSLQHNKIEKVEGLEALDKLDVLSLGDNDIRGADEVARYFRGLTSTIRSLSFSNNPVYVPR